MSNQLKNKIEATNTNIKSLLKDQKFYIDYFQREFRWKSSHINLLMEDLTSKFMKSYDPADKRPAVSGYDSYYLGPVVFSENPDDGKKSIIDGQQRITSITLLLIYLNHLQKDIEHEVPISALIFSEKYGEKSFNMTDKAREPCLKALFDEGSYKYTEDDETIQNIVDRYEDITQAFPEELSSEALPYFIDWFIEKVIIVKITAYSDDNAYTIFETMNDRGLNLTPTEMLKGFVISRITDANQRIEINDLWKKQIQKLHEYGETTDQSFFQAWFRSKYAVSIRPGKVGSENQDFEHIGSRFHNWFKDNHKKLLGLESSDDFYNFFKNEFPFFVKWYIRFKDSQETYDKTIPHLNYIKNWGIADSLQEPLLLSAIESSDSDNIIEKKLDFIARFIETFTVRRSVNYKKFAQTSIRYTMFNLIRLIRSNSLEKLSKDLTNEINKLEYGWETIHEFRLHGQNRKFVRHLLCRISAYIDDLIGNSDNTYAYYHDPQGTQFEIEHIWANKFEEHRDEFDQEKDFDTWRNSIGALILLPNGTNQSFNSDKYKDKLKYYIEENAYAQSLSPTYYEKNPRFTQSDEILKLQFSPHPEFNKADVKDRLDLVKRICSKLWSVEYFQF